MNGRILRLFKISLYSVQMRMAPSWFYLLTIITWCRLVFSVASAKHISQGLEFKSLELCGKITGPQIQKYVPVKTVQRCSNPQRSSPDDPLVGQLSNFAFESSYAGELLEDKGVTKCSRAPLIASPCTLISIPR